VSTARQFCSQPLCLLAIINASSELGTWYSAWSQRVNKATSSLYVTCLWVRGWEHEGGVTLWGHVRRIRCKHRVYYLLTPWNRVLLEKLTGFQLVKKFPSFYGTLRFITAFTSDRHLSLSWASSIQSIPPHPTSWSSILILATHLLLGHPRGKQSGYNLMFFWPCIIV